MLRDPAAGRAFYARLYSYSRLKKSGPLIAFGIPPGLRGFLISASAVPHGGACEHAATLYIYIYIYSVLKEEQTRTTSSFHHVFKLSIYINNLKQDDCERSRKQIKI